jgi:hypothetical protein
MARTSSPYLRRIQTFTISIVVQAFQKSQDLNDLKRRRLYNHSLDDEIIETKCRLWGYGLVITKVQNVRLWRGYIRSDCC